MKNMFGLMMKWLSALYWLQSANGTTLSLFVKLALLVCVCVSLTVSVFFVVCVSLTDWVYNIFWLMKNWRSALYRLQPANGTTLSLFAAPSFKATWSPHSTHWWGGGGGGIGCWRYLKASDSPLWPFLHEFPLWIYLEHTCSCFGTSNFWRFKLPLW